MINHFIQALKDCTIKFHPITYEHSNGCNGNAFPKPADSALNPKLEKAFAVEIRHPILAMRES